MFHLSNTVIIIVIIAIIITIVGVIVALKNYKNQNPNQEKEKEKEKESNSHVVVLTNNRIKYPDTLIGDYFGGKRKKKRFIKRKGREKPLGKK